MADTRAPAGGRATSSGIEFQWGVGSWFAAHLLAERAIGSRFGINVAAVPTYLRFETGVGLDDVVVTLSDGGGIYVQCKSTLNLEQAVDSALGRTIAQLVRQFYAPSLSDAERDPRKYAGVLAVGPGTPASLDVLEQGCRLLDLGADWESLATTGSDAIRSAMGIFGTHAGAAFHTLLARTPTSDELAQLARLFHVIRFDVDGSGRDWAAAASVLGDGLFGDANGGTLPMGDLVTEVARLTKSGAAATGAGLIAALRAKGHVDTRSPRYERDLARLRSASDDELERLRRHSKLPIDGGVAIARECLPALVDAVDNGSLLVVGDPGVGKTGVLVAFADAIAEAGRPIVVLSVEQLAGIAVAGDVERALGLGNPLVDCLDAWPGGGRAVLLIDALDAARGGPAETILASLIESAIARIGERWSVVASIRTFDLRNGRRYRQAMKGSPPSAAHVEHGVAEVRHFKVPELSAGELDQLAARSPRLSSLVEAAPVKLLALLRNVFNLSLASELINSGADPAGFRELTTQSALIDRYEDVRLPEHAHRLAIAAAIKAMIAAGRLAIRETDVDHDQLDRVVHAGVLVKVGDRVSFSHHVLFDHAAARYVLPWDNIEHFAKQVSDSSSIGLLLSPSIRFAVDRIWQDVELGAAYAWRLVRRLAGDAAVDAVVTSAALRTAVSLVRSPDDVAGIGELIGRSADATGVSKFLATLARFVRMRIIDGTDITDAQRRAWIEVACASLGLSTLVAADASRVILRAVLEQSEKVKQALPSDFGPCARALLSYAWSLEEYRPVLTSDAVSMVAKSFASSPVESRSLLERILAEPQFSAHAHHEGRELANGIDQIVAADAEFAVRIYAAFFLRNIVRDETTYVGGHTSRILPITTSVKQDYGMVRWHLGKKLKRFLESSPEFGTRAVNAALVGLQDIEHGPDKEHFHLSISEVPFHVVEDGRTWQEWRTQRQRGSSEESVLPSFVEFLRESSPAAFRSAVETTRRIVSATSVWARLFGIGIERPDIADDLLWPCASHWDLLLLPSILRDGVAYLASCHSRRPAEERRAFETSLIERYRNGDEQARLVMERWLSLMPIDSLATQDMRDLRIALETAKRLTGNPPLMTITSYRKDGEDVVKGLLEASGVDLASAADRKVYEATKRLREVHDATAKDSKEAEVAALWSALSQQLEVVDSCSSAHRESLHAALGMASNALERIVESPAFVPGSPGHPTFEASVQLAERFARSPYPEPSGEKDDAVMGWGNWDVRVYGASCLMALARRPESSGSRVHALLRALLADPVGTVRLQVAQSLNTLWEVARSVMWELAEYLVQRETSVGVLGFFVAGPLTRFTWHEPERAERLLSALLTRLSRVPADDARNSSRRHFDEGTAHVLTVLWVVQGRTTAQSSIHDLLHDLVANDELLWHIVSQLREPLFSRFLEGTPAAGEMQQRARELLAEIVAAAAGASTTAQATLKADTSPAAVESAGPLFTVGEKLLSHACDQLYFGAGAFTSQGDEQTKGLTSPDTMRQFLVEYRSILRTFGSVGQPGTLHNLLELYAYLADADPGIVFDELAAVLEDHAPSTGFQYEALAVDSVVGLVRRYLADHRDVFEDQHRRESLLRVLGVFSDAGWPEAIALLYDLPDLLR